MIKLKHKNTFFSLKKQTYAKALRQNFRQCLNIRMFSPVWLLVFFLCHQAVRRRCHRSTIYEPYVRHSLHTTQANTLCEKGTLYEKFQAAGLLCLHAQTGFF